MGTGSLTSRSSGQVITAAFFNDFYSAFNGDFVGRNSSGVATSGQNLGTATYPWGTVRANQLVIGGSAVDTTQLTSPPARVVSGAVRSTSNQPAYIDPAGSGNGASVDVLATTTDLVFSVAGEDYTLTADITKSSLSAAPSSNNTCLVNDSNAADGESTRTWGEAGSDNETITVDTMDSEITSLVGTYQAFSIAGAATEYFVAYVKSTTELTSCFRGFFYDDSIAPINRTVFTNNDTITLMKLHYIFLDKDLATVDTTTTAPLYQSDTPGSPATGDYWWDTANMLWKRYNGSSFDTVDRAFVGWAVMDDTDCVAARSVDFDAKYQLENSIKVRKEDDATLKGKTLSQIINVAGVKIEYETQTPEWDMANDLAVAADMYNSSEQADTVYYFYIKDDGDTVISDISPYEDTGRAGKYHPHNPWRLVATCTNGLGSNLDETTIVNETIGTGGSDATGDKIIYKHYKTISSVRVAEDVDEGEAVCLVHYNQDDFLYNLTDADLAKRRNSFQGIAANSSSGTQGVYTLNITANGPLVTGNTITASLNGRTYVQAFDTDNDTTMAAFAAQLNADPDVESCSVVAAGGDDTDINITGSNGINGTAGYVTILASASVSGGASQATFTFGTTTAAASGTLNVQINGVRDDQTGLTAGRYLYLSTTAGAMTQSPTDNNPVRVAYALTSTSYEILESDQTKKYAGPAVMVRSHGRSTSGHADGQLDVEHFNFTTWASGTSAGTAYSQGPTGSVRYADFHAQQGGTDTSDNPTDTLNVYNQSTWSAKTATGTARADQSSAYSSAFGDLIVGYGTNASSVPESNQHDDVYIYSGSTWATQTDTGNNYTNGGAFTDATYWYMAGPMNASSAAADVTRRWNDSTFSAGTAPGNAAGNTPNSGGESYSGGGFVGANRSSTGTTFDFDGSSWATGASMGYTVSDAGSNVGHIGACTGNTSTTSYNNGGHSSSALNTTRAYDGSAWSSDTASGNSRAGAFGSIV